MLNNKYQEIQLSSKAGAAPLYGSLGKWIDTSILQDKHVLLLFGGKSTEHMVSCRSAAFVAATLEKLPLKLSLAGITMQGDFLPFPYSAAELHSDNWEALALAAKGSEKVNLPFPCRPADFFAALTKDGSKVDLVFPVLHGINCEDGALQGLLKLADLPYVGGDVLASALGMNKITSKKLLEAANFPVVPWLEVKRHAYLANAEQVCSEIEKQLPYPLFVKPANGGSSVGAQKAKTREELLAALALACSLDSRVLVEEFHQVRELECGVLGNDNARVASVVGEIIVHAEEFYDYQTKYFSDSASEAAVPAVIEPTLAQEIRRMSLDICHSLEIAGLARVDFFLDKQSGKLYFNEVNTLPGFTSISLYPQVFAASGIGAEELCSYLLSAAWYNHQDAKRQETL